MNFVHQLMTKALGELTILEFSIGSVLLVALGLTVGFVAYRLFLAAIDDAKRRDIEDWYNNPSRWEE